MARAAQGDRARDVARALSKTAAFEQSRRYRKRVEMLFAHLKRILRLGRLRLRGQRKMSSRLPRSLKTCVGSLNSSPAHHHYPLRVWRKRQTLRCSLPASGAFTKILMLRGDPLRLLLGLCCPCCSLGMLPILL